MKKLLVFFLLVFVTFLGIFLYTWNRLHKALDLRVSESSKYVKQYPLPFYQKYFTTKDGVKIASWYIPVKNAKAVVILVHGYSTSPGGKSLMLPHAQYLYRAGYTTLLIDLRSYGQSQGNKITLGVNEWQDVSAAYDYVKSLPENKNAKIGFLGQSMGAVSVINEAGITGKGDFIIASVPFDDFSSLFAYKIQKENFPVFLFLPIMRLAAYFELGYNYDYYTPAHQIDKIHVPILFIEAAQDQDVNKNDVQLLFNHANMPKDLWIAQAPHDVYEYNPLVFQEHVLHFLNANLH